jgi:hypothetical protein
MKKKERVPVKKKMKNLFRSPITAAGASILIGQRSPKKKKEKKAHRSILTLFFRSLLPCTS